MVNICKPFIQAQMVLRKPSIHKPSYFFKIFHFDFAAPVHFWYKIKGLLFGPIGNQILSLAGSAIVRISNFQQKLQRHTLLPPIFLGIHLVGKDSWKKREVGKL